MKDASQTTDPGRNSEPRPPGDLGLEAAGVSHDTLGSPTRKGPSSPNPPGNDLFSRYGVEIEYAVVHRESLNVQPVVDELSGLMTGDADGVTPDDIVWSYELVNHVLELKLGEPAISLADVAARFQRNVQHANATLAAFDCCLLPTGMHPWMDPATETVLWKHEDHEIYRTYDRIFDCRRHGWANLQSVHLNLPFADDRQFRRLHSAIRLLLPLLPALAASSPFCDGARAKWLDTRLEFYRTNSRSIPSVTGHVVPEVITDQAEYHEEILGRIYRDMLPHDPDRTLADDWLNARGAIARFERGTIELRVLDTQECPAADLAILQFIVAVLKRLVDESISPLEFQEAPGLKRLAREFRNVIRAGRAARITDRMLLRAFGHRSEEDVTAGMIWRELLNRIPAQESAAWRDTIEMILGEGCLAERIVRAAGDEPDKDSLRTIYRRLSACLAHGKPFE